MLFLCSPYPKIQVGPSRLELETSALKELCTAILCYDPMNRHFTNFVELVLPFHKISIKKAASGIPERLFLVPALRFLNPESGGDGYIRTYGW